MTEIKCPVCRNGMEFREARNKRSGKPSIQLLCPVDPRHFRGFINDRDFVAQVIGHTETDLPGSHG